MNINVYPEENICRFCLESENPERLIVACRCSGTMKYVHDYCLIKWTNTTTNAEARNKCITCGYTYKKVPPRTYCLKHFCSAIQYSPFLIFLHNFLVSLFFATPCTMYLLVDYKYKYSHKNNQNCKQSNPLVAINESENNGEEMYNGDIIHVNSLTDQMINYLLMSYSELEKYSGHNTPQQYKTQIIKAINLFWD